MKLFQIPKFLLIGILNFLLLSVVFGQTTVINDPLSGGTSAGKQYGGRFTSEGYIPGTGTNHILYTVPSKATNGYVEFQVKGVNASSFASGAEHGFLIMYDGRGIAEPVAYLPDFRENFFRWNLHWRQNRNAFKAVISCAAPIAARLNATRAVFPGNWTLEDRDFTEEPTGSGISWNPSSWYTIRVEWKDKHFKVYVNGSKKWEAHGPYDYDPIDHKIWLGSGTGKYGADISNVVYRNFKVVDYGGGQTTPTNSLAVSPSSKTVSSTSGSTTFSVSSNVSWNVSDNASWVSVSPSSGSNSGTLTATYSANTGSSSRSATITTSGGGITRVVTLTQNGTSSSGGGGSTGFTVSPTSKTIGMSSGYFNLTINTSGTWYVRDNTDWLRKIPKTGTGNGSTRIEFSANTTGKQRTGIVSVTVGSQVKEVKITQESSVANTNSLTVSPISKSVGSSSGSTSYSVSSNVSWTTGDNASWLTVSPSSGSNNGTLTASFLANTSSSSRSATINISGGGLNRSVTLTQSGVSSSGGGSSFAVSPSSKSVNNSAGYFDLAITTKGSWRVRDNTDWMKKVPKTGTGNGISRISYLANTTGKPRTGIVSVTVGSEVKEVIVTQGGTSSGGNLVVSPTSKDVSGSAGYFNLSISTNGSWRVRDNTNWMRKIPKTGTGNGSTRIEYIANTTGKARTGTISVEVGTEVKKVLVTQSASGQVVASAKGSENGRNESAITSGENSMNVIPDTYALGQNYPNPFNPSTTIKFGLPEAGFTEIIVYNSIGEVVKKIMSEFKAAGSYQINFDASNLSSGIYYYTLKSGKFVENKKMILLK